MEKPDEPITLSPENASQIQGMLMSPDIGDYKLALAIIDNSKDTSRDVVDDIFNGLITSDNTFVKNSIPNEFWIIKLNGVVVKPKNSGNGLYKSKQGAKNALSAHLTSMSSWWRLYNQSQDSIPTHKMSRLKYTLNTIKQNLFTKRYKHPRRKTAGYYLDERESIIKMFYEKNQVEFIKITIPI